MFYLARMISAQKQTEFYHSDYDRLKRVRSIWICMDSNEDGDSIEEISLEQKTIFGEKKRFGNIDLMKGIVIRVRSRDAGKTSQNTLIAMLEKLLCHMDAEEKKRILTKEYGMIMTTELEGRIQTMCNLSECIEARGMEKGIEKGIEKGKEKERLDAIKRMRKAGASREQILLYGYTEEEYDRAESQ